ncbi:hypothetical protein Swit_5340 (plasmid) [Rhizorhabdus wittichii RW1]|uniref:Uncharacterized protein n=1 Tax=Rhizorhabdus wittichii (strain DSM 6014 / CCUG 31198 / JCM 15750 / NBRC 105917 / EY 4224 / RW1) TaxID=392499 RepID=A0A9J9LGN0_RHIWR|nr:hypothetical protein Swit_5340 [Rhizorhabdus wittichii RW1]
MQHRGAECDQPVRRSGGLALRSALGGMFVLKRHGLEGRNGPQCAVAGIAEGRRVSFRLGAGRQPAIMLSVIRHEQSFRIKTKGRHFMPPSSSLSPAFAG